MIPTNCKHDVLSEVIIRSHAICATCEERLDYSFLHDKVYTYVQKYHLWERLRRLETWKG